MVARTHDGASIPVAQRLHWIDWLRVAAIAGVFVYHTLRPFNTDDWHVKNAETSAALNGLTTFFGSFGLAVLFLLAGAGVRFALRRRTWQTFIRERTARLLVPFVVGTLLLGPPQAFMQAIQKAAYAGSYVDYLGVWAGDTARSLSRGLSPTVFGIGYHLWFLGFLFAISIIALPLCRWLMGERGRAWIGAFANRFSWPGVTLTLVIPLFALMGIGSTLGTQEHDWFEFAWYFGYFLIGFLLVSDDRFMAAVQRDLWPAAGLAAVSTGLIIAAIPAPLDTAGEHGMGPIDLAIGVLFVAMGWSWTLLVLNIGMRLRRLQRPVREHLGDAVLPLYVIHQPVILAVAFVVVQWPLGILPKWLVVFGVSLPITLVLVELVLRTPISRILIGARVRSAAPLTPAPAPVGPDRPATKPLQGRRSVLDLAERPAIAARPWLAQYDAGVPTMLGYPAVRVDELLDRAARRYPDRAALRFFGRQTSYRALNDAVDEVADGLRRLGLCRGERVALFMPNCPQMVVSFYAVWRAGCIAVPVSPQAKGPELSRYLGDAGAAAAIVLDRLWLGRRDAALPPTVRHLVVARVADDLPLLLKIGARLSARGSAVRHLPAAPDAVPFRKLLRRGHPEAMLDPAGPDDPAVLLYTGGTTGLPKAAVLKHRNLVANACQLGAWASDLDDGAEVMLSALPLAHGYAMTTCMNTSVLRGWTQVLTPDPRDVERLLREIERWRVTVFPGVPTLYASICGHPAVTSGRRDLRSIEDCISGAAPLPSGIQADFERLSGGRLVEGYGLTEASPATHCNPLGAGRQSDGIGLPLPDTDCRLVDLETETTDVAPGKPGVLCVSGPQVMAGYWQRPDDTAQVLHRDDDGRVWLHTGDVAEMSADGYFRIVDRKKDIIVAAGGLKVYPNELEDVLSTHPKVRLSAVIGVPVGSPDQRAKAFVVLREGARADIEEITAFLGERLAPYKIPKVIEFRAELPLAFTGKVLRRVLAEEERRRNADAGEVAHVGRARSRERDGLPGPSRDPA